MIKAVLFDLDGVLVDAVKLHQKAFIEAVKPYKEITEEYHMKYLNGIPTKKKLEKLGFYTDLIEKINAEKQEITFKLIPEMINPIPEVLEVINEIKKLQIPFCVCSNSIRKSTELLLLHGGVDGFQFIISNQEVINPKPDPEMYLKAIERLKLDKSEILIVEDSPVGMEAANKSGANVCQIKNPSDIKRVLEELEKFNQ
ncbi:HAD family phosphatase [Candidatus Pacearchaeota archaeon]|nr:HAD family phosphatase [Candidatus Pacearchaeota archaeon]